MGPLTATWCPLAVGQLSSTGSVALVVRVWWPQEAGSKGQDQAFLRAEVSPWDGILTLPPAVLQGWKLISASIGCGVHSYNLSTVEAEAGRSPGVKSSLGYTVRSCIEEMKHQRNWTPAPKVNATHSSAFWGAGSGHCSPLSFSVDLQVRIFT